MASYKLFEAEFRMMCLIWQHEPITSPELVRMCFDKFCWKNATTYTQIKRMIDRGFIKSEKTVITALVKREQVEQYDSEEIVEGRFGGSLPKFVTAFMGTRRMSREELDELQRILDEYKGD